MSHLKLSVVIDPRACFDAPQHFNYGGILMLVSDTDTDTDSNSALGDRLFWNFATWPHLPYCSSYCSGISSVLND